MFETIFVIDQELRAEQSSTASSLFEKMPPYEVSVAPSANSSIILHLDLPGKTTQVRPLEHSLIFRRRGGVHEGMDHSRRIAVQLSRPLARCSFKKHTQWVKFIDGTSYAPLLTTFRGEIFSPQIQPALLIYSTFFRMNSSGCPYGRPLDRCPLGAPRHPTFTSPPLRDLM